MIKKNVIKVLAIGAILLLSSLAVAHEREGGVEKRSIIKAVHKEPDLSHPEHDSGTVSLPLTEYTELMKKAEGPSPVPEPEAPYEYAITEARYIGDVKAEEITFDVALTLNVLSREWVRIKLMKSDLKYVVGDFSSGDLKAELSIDPEGYYTVTLKEPGVHIINYNIHIPLEKEFDRSKAEFPAPESSVNYLEIRAEQYYRISIKPASHGVKTVRSESGLHYTCFVPKTDKISIFLDRAERETYSFTRASYTSEIREGVIAMHADYNLEVFSIDPVGIPIADLSLALGSVSVDGKENAVFMGDRAFMLKGLKPGKHKISIEIFKRVEESEEARSVRIPVISSPISMLSVTVPGEAVNLEIQPGVNQVITTRGKKTTASVTLPITNIVIITWTEKAPELKKVVSAKEEKLRMHAETKSVLALEDGILRVSASVDFDILRGELSKIIFDLPSGAEVMSVEGKYIKDWTTDRGEESTRYEVYLDRKVRATYGLKVKYEQLMEELPVTVSYPSMIIQGVEREKGALTVMRNPALKVKASAVEGLRRVETEESDDPVSGPLMIYKYLKRPYALSLDLLEPDIPEPEVTARLSALLSIEDGIMRCYTNIGYSILHSGVDTFRVNIPAGVKVSSIYGKDIRSKKINQNDETHEVTIVLNKRVRGNYQLFIDYEKILAGNDTSFLFPFIELPGLKTVEAYIGVQALNNIEIEGVPEKNVQEIDLSQLPSIVADRADSLILMAYNYTDIAGLEKARSLRFTIKKHADVSVQDVVIDEARYMTLVLGNGVVWTKGIFSIRNKSQQFIKIKLPHSNESEVRSAFLAGNAVRPSRNEAGEILLPLAKSESDKGRLIEFPLELVYFTPVSAYSSIGKQKLELPEVDVTIINTQWLLYLPEQFDYRRIGGNMRIVRTIFSGEKANTEFLKNFGKGLSGNFLKFQAGRKQSEVKSNLFSIYSAQRAYHQRNNCFGKSFDKINWSPSGWNRYSYYMGTDYIPAHAANEVQDAGPVFQLRVTDSTFVAVAVGNIDSDPFQDIWFIDHDKKLINLADDSTNTFSKEYEKLRAGGIVGSIEALNGESGARVSAARTGVLPIHLDIPRRGKLYQFEKLFANEDRKSPRPVVSFWYVPSIIGRTVDLFKWGTISIVILVVGVLIYNLAKAHGGGLQYVARHWKWVIPVGVIVWLVWRNL